MADMNGKVKLIAFSEDDLKLIKSDLLSKLESLEKELESAYLKAKDPHLTKGLSDFSISIVFEMAENNISEHKTLISYIDRVLEDKGRN